MESLDLPIIKSGDHKGYMQYALSLAGLSPRRQTNYRVGLVLVDADTNTILTTGYTLELEGNTPAEQCCLLKFSARHEIPEQRLAEVLPENTLLYTTVEPCEKRLSGNLPCTDRILGFANCIRTIYVGVKEPEKFVGENKNKGRAKLEEAGIGVVFVDGLSDEILKVATAGHGKEPTN